MRRALLLLLLPVALLTGCAGDPAPPQVQFAAGQQPPVTARPTQYCNIEFTECRNDADAPVTLRVPAGTPVTVTVPAEIASTPWQIAFTTISGDGTRSDGRTPVFAPNARTDYTLTLPAPTDRLLTAEVQQFGAPPQANEADGGIDFPIRASWVLTTTL